MGTSYNDHSASMAPGAVGPLVKQIVFSQSMRSPRLFLSRLPLYVMQHPGGLFIVGKPNDYHLSAALPRLPSYDSVRKQDRQRQVHIMIAQRFGLSGSQEEVSR